MITVLKFRNFLVGALLFIFTHPLFSQPVFTVLATDLSGLYSSNINLVYEITKKSDGNYSWVVSKTKQEGSIQQFGNKVSATWRDANGATGAAQGEIIKVLPGGKSDIIKFNNGVIFERVKVIYETSSCSATEDLTCGGLILSSGVCAAACIAADPCGSLCTSCIENAFTFGINCHRCLFGNACGRGNGDSGGPSVGGGLGVRGYVLCEPCRPFDHRGSVGSQFCTFYKGAELINSFTRKCIGRSDF